MSELAERHARLKAWLFDAALPLWWTAGADPNGGFHEMLGQDGSAIAAPRRARVQARQTYVYALAGRLGWDGPWRAAMDHGFRFLVDRYGRPDGLFRTRVRADGAPDDETAVLDDQAFALFAMAAVRAASPDRDDLPAKAAALLEAAQAHFHHDGRGLREASADRPFQSNPHMHLFEAALAWSEADPAAGVWPALADRIAELCMAKFIDAETGALREFFDDAWRPAPGVDGRIVEPGHQFEWAWLLQRWGAARDRPDACAAAERLFQIGCSYGVDRARGVAMDSLLDDFSVHDASARLWPQTERIKAAVLLAARADGDRRRHALDDAAAGAAGLSLYLSTPVAGLWRDSLDREGRFVEQPAPASSFYHIILAIAELGRLPGLGRP